MHFSNNYNSDIDSSIKNNYNDNNIEIDRHENRYVNSSKLNEMGNNRSILNNDRNLITKTIESVGESKNKSELLPLQRGREDSREEKRSGKKGRKIEQW